MFIKKGVYLLMGVILSSFGLITVAQVEQKPKKAEHVLAKESSLDKSQSYSGKPSQEKPHHSAIKAGWDKIAEGFDRFLRALGLSEPIEPPHDSGKKE